MTWYRCKANSAISLLSNCKIGVSETLVKQNPIDTDNYITIENNTITLTRTNSSYNLWIFTPKLKANTIYAFSFDSVTNTDNNVYLDYADVVSSVGDLTVTRLGSITLTQLSTCAKGLVFKTTNAGQYGFPIWANSLNDLSIENPQIIEVG